MIPLGSLTPDHEIVNGSSSPAPFAGATGAGGAAAPGELQAAVSTATATASGARKRRRFMFIPRGWQPASLHFSSSRHDGFSGAPTFGLIVNGSTIWTSAGAAREHAAKVFTGGLQGCR